MTYNKAIEERKWKKWKQQEEMKLRQYGMDEQAILELRRLDWEVFNAERRFREHQEVLPEYPAERESLPKEREIRNVRDLLDAIENEQLLHIMLNADKTTLQLLLLKMMGYSTREIAGAIGIREKTIYTKLERLKKKIKKFYKGEENRVFSSAI